MSSDDRAWFDGVVGHVVNARIDVGADECPRQISPSLSMTKLCSSAVATGFY